ncbi:MAG: TonB-dependent receptor [Gammaproteobacteria bacterium]|nr:TonB-dependent receptor [Gammaproteobacteria bacterium]
MAEPIVSVRDDRTIADVSIDQVRLVAGVRGDMPFMNFGSVEDWSFDFYLMQSKSTGESSRGGIREDRLYYSLDTSRFSVPGDPTSEVICGNNDGCVPINMFAPSLYNPLLGNFATQEEKDYVWDSRDFDTEITQTLGQFYMNGEIFSLPGGEALFGLGVEYREDEINSIPDDIARDGLFFAFFADQGAVGQKWTKEYFGELELPLLAGVTAFRELTVNVSSRHTEDEYYGKAWTYSGKLAWRPVDSLLLRGTVGTSYRAPNLRENFLLGTTGFDNSLFDPCIIPDAARNPLTGGYDPTLDDREPEVLANCLANGVDPTTFDNFGNSFVSAEVSSGGALDVNEEESESFSAGFTWEQPFFTSFDMVLGATYYDIQIKNEIIEPSGQFIVNDCYNDLQGDSPFCARIRRGGDGFIDLIDQGFINRDSQNARGVDVNMRIDYPTQIFGRAVDLQADFAFNRTLSLESIFIGDDGNASRDEFVGEFAVPEWKGRMSFRADYEDWRVTWSTRYISSVEQDAEGIDDFGNIVDGLSSTCGGPLLDDVNCRDVGFAENYFVNDMSLYYYGDVWTLGGGIRNVFNEAPPTVDGSEVFAFNNVPFGSGYDFLGRQLFLNAVWRWD